MEQEVRITIEITKDGYIKKLCYDGKEFYEEWKSDRNLYSSLMNESIYEQLVACGYPDSILNVIDKTYARFTPAEIMSEIP